MKIRLQALVLIALIAAMGGFFLGQGNHNPPWNVIDWLAESPAAPDHRGDGFRERASAAENELMPFLVESLRVVAAAQLPDRRGKNSRAKSNAGDRCPRRLARKCWPAWPRNWPIAPAISAQSADALRPIWRRPSFKGPSRPGRSTTSR